MRLFQNRKQEHPQRLSSDSDILTTKTKNKQTLASCNNTVTPLKEILLKHPEKQTFFNTEIKHLGNWE